MILKFINDNNFESDYVSYRDSIILQLAFELAPRPAQIHSLEESDFIVIQGQNLENIYYCIELPILDTGIANIPHLAPWMHSENITYYTDSDINKNHGTFVAGVLLYGDELEGKAYTGFDGCKLFEAIVMPDLTKQKIYESELIEQIRDAVSRYDHIKIWNLSLGTDREADLYEFSDFAKALDEIQEHHDVLICKSAGNCQNFRIDAPKSRITKSADTVRGIVVGSLTHDKNTTDHADKHNPSPFSRKGPGPSHLIKPDVVHIGGNAGLNTANALVINPALYLNLVFLSCLSIPLFLLSSHSDSTRLAIISSDV